MLPNLSKQIKLNPSKIFCYKKNTQLKDISLQEVKVIRLICLGYTTKEIANLLYLSPRTVEIHRRNIYKKLNIKKKHQLVKIFIESGLILSELPCFKNSNNYLKYCFINKTQCPKCGLFYPKDEDKYLNIV